MNTHLTTVVLLVLLLVTTSAKELRAQSVKALLTEELLSIPEAFLLVPTSATELPAQSQKPLSTEERLSLPLEERHIKQQGLPALFSHIALRYDIPIGVEVAINDDLSAWYELRGNTLTEMLDQFVAKHSDYYWVLSEGVVNVFPRERGRDRAVDEILQTTVSRLTIKPRTVTFSFVHQLVESSEVKTIMTERALSETGWGFSGFALPQLGQEFARTFENCSVRSILNEVARESPVAKFWIIRRFADDNSLLIGVHANFENGLKIRGRVQNGPPVVSISLEID